MGDARKATSADPIWRRGATQPRRRGGKITVTQALSEEERVRSLASVRRARERERRAQQQDSSESAKVIREVVIPETLTVQELANRMALRGAEVIKQLMKMGSMATINQAIDADTAELLVVEFGHKPKRVSESDVEIGLKGEGRSHGTAAKRARPLSRSWGMSITARRRSWMRCAGPTSPPARRVVSPNISAPIK